MALKVGEKTYCSWQNVVIACIGTALITALAIGILAMNGIRVEQSLDATLSVTAGGVVSFVAIFGGRIYFTDARFGKWIVKLINPKTSKDPYENKMTIGNLKNMKLEKNQVFVYTPDADPNCRILRTGETNLIFTKNAQGEFVSNKGIHWNDAVNLYKDENCTFVSFRE